MAKVLVTVQWAHRIKFFTRKGKVYLKESPSNIAIKMMKYTPLFFLFCLTILYSCQSKKELAISHKVVVNPYGFAPLTAGVVVEGIAEPVTATVTVQAKGAGEISLTRSVTIKPRKKEVIIPVIGLYADHLNKVDILFKDQSNNQIGTLNLDIQTEKIPFGFLAPPKTEGDLGDNQMILTTLYSFKFEKGKDMDFIQKGVGLDGKGRIRWYGDFKGRKHLVLEVMDGKIYAGSNTGSYAGKLVAYNFLGEELEVYDFSKEGKYYNVHHDIRKTKNGSFLLTVNEKGSKSVENYILEYNPNLLGNRVQVELDLEEIMPNVDDYFINLPYSYYVGKSDVLHINGIYPYPDGEHVIVSSRNAGVAKINLFSSELKWYMFPHSIKASAGTEMVKEEAKMRSYLEERLKLYEKDKVKYKRTPANGVVPFQDYLEFVFNYEEFLLRPLDKSGKEITDREVVYFGQYSPEFSFPMRQHAPIVLKNGNIAIFDNRDINRNKNKASRAVEYKIVEDANGYGGTVQQVWEYKPASEKFAINVGDVRELPSGNRLVNFGSFEYEIGVKERKPTEVLIVEVTSDTPAKEVFKMDLVLTKGSVAYRADKVDLSTIE